MFWLPSRSGMMRRTALALAVAALVSTCGTFLQLSGTLSDFDVAAQDAVGRVRVPESFLSESAHVNPAADPRSFVTIVAIDNRTLAELGAYNGGYPRRYHAQLIEKLLAAPPRVIALDIGFFEPTADDELLAAALDHARSLPLPTSVILGAVGLVSNASQSAAAASHTEPSFDGGLLPVPTLAARADIGLANVAPDARGTIRSIPLFARLAGVEQPTLGLAAMAKYLGDRCPPMAVPMLRPCSSPGARFPSMPPRRCASTSSARLHAPISRLRRSGSFRTWTCFAAG